MRSVRTTDVYCDCVGTGMDHWGLLGRRWDKSRLPLTGGARRVAGTGGMRLTGRSEVDGCLTVCAAFGACLDAVSFFDEFLD